MFLAFDIGNSTINIGIFDKERLLGTEQFLSGTEKPAESLDNTLDSLLHLLHLNRAVIQGCGISSVVPRLTAILSRWANENFQRSPLIVSAELPIGIKIHYDDPLMLGADRICTTVSAFKKYGGPAIVIDFGTATTYDLISERGDFLGGIIAPGIKTAGDALTRNTAQLPPVELHFPEKVIGNNTISCIQSGILYSGLDAAEGIIDRLKKITGPKTNVIATGGLGELIFSKSKKIDHLEKNLVLEGIFLISRTCGNNTR